MKVMLWIFMVGLSALVSADVIITTEPGQVSYGGSCEPVYGIRFRVDNDDFRDASPDHPIYVRLTLDHDVSLCETLVARSESIGSHQPIYLPITTENIFSSEMQINADPKSIAIARWIAGEKEIWLAVYSSSSTWVLRDGEPTAPSYDHPVEFQLGTLSRPINYPQLFERGLSNRSGPATASGQALNIQINLDMTRANLQLDSSNQCSSFSFDPIAGGGSRGVETEVNPRRIDMGVQTSINFSNGPVLGRVSLDRRHHVLPWISNSSAFQSELVLNNPDDTPLTVTLFTEGQDGMLRSTTRTLDPFSRLREPTQTLFPDLRGRFALELTGLKTPAVLQLTDNSSGEVGAVESENLPGLWQTVPVERAGDVNSAVVLLNRGIETETMTLQFYDTNGNLQDEAVVEGLEPNRPRALLMSELTDLTGEYNVHIRSQSMLLAMAYRFDKSKTPLMTYGNIKVHERVGGSVYWVCKH